MAGLSTYLARQLISRTIWLGGHREKYDEVLLTGTPKPGYLIQIYDNAGVRTGRAHPTPGARTQASFLVEDNLQGKTIDDAYASGDLGRFVTCKQGDTIQCKLPASAAAVVFGDPLVSNGDGTLIKASIYANGSLYSSAAASAAISNTVTATAFDKSFTIPANSLVVGDQIRIRLQGIVTAANSTDTLAIALKIGSTTIATLAATDVAANDIFGMDITLNIRTIGASGTWVAFGTTTLFGQLGTADAIAFYKASTAIDTTAAQAITVVATWSVANAGNSVRLDVLSVDRASAATGTGAGTGAVMAYADADLDASAVVTESFLPIIVA